MASCAECRWAIWDKLGGVAGECKAQNHKLSAAMEPTDVRLGNILHGRVNQPKGWEAPKEFTYRVVSVSWLQDKDCYAYESKA